MGERICGHHRCEQELGDDPRQLYCCRGHKENARRARRYYKTADRTCAWCSGAYVIYAGHDTQYCSKGCSWAARRERTATWQLTHGQPIDFDLRYGFIADTSRRKHMGPIGAAYRVALRNDPCAYCGEPALVIDHILPRADGGADGWENMTAACVACNLSKRKMSLLTFLLANRVLEAMRDDATTLGLLIGPRRWRGRDPHELASLAGRHIG